MAEPKRKNKEPARGEGELTAYDGHGKRRRNSREEVNLANLPGLLAEDKEKAELIFSHDDFGSIAMVNKSYGLPTTTDEIILAGLAGLTFLRGVEGGPLLRFSKYELLRFLNWETHTQNYRRVNLALDRYNTTQYKITKWRDRAGKVQRVSGMVILPHYETEYREGIVERWQEGDFKKPDSFIEWHSVVWKGFREGNVRPVDILLLASLRRTPRAVRLYRLIENGLKHADECFEFDTLELAERARFSIPLARGNPHNGKLITLLDGAFESLEKKGYLKGEVKRERYWKDKETGRWKGRVYRSKPKVYYSKSESEGMRLLISNGVGRRVSEKLAKEYPLSQIQRHVAHALWLRARKSKRVSRNLPGFIVKSIRTPYEFEEEFLREYREPVRASAKPSTSQPENPETEGAEPEVKKYLAGLTREERDAFDRAARAAARPGERGHLAQGGKIAETQLQILYERYYERTVSKAA